jgi:MGT family glycosyltransferase
VTPTLPLVAELVRRGHRVEYACGPEFREAIGRAGAQWVAMPGLAPFVPPAQVGPEIVALWFRHFFAGLAATYPVLLAHCRAHRPDAVVYDATNWPARLVARRMGLPAVRTIPNLAENETYSQVNDALNSGLKDDPQMAAFADDVAGFAATHGVDLEVAGTMDVVEDLNLVFVARAFQPAGDSFDDRFRFVGAMIGGREQVQSWSSPHPELPLLFVSLGSIFTDRPDFYRTCVEAFGDSHFQVAMTMGDVDPADVGHPCRDELDDGSALLRRPHARASSDARTGGQCRPRRRARPRTETRPAGHHRGRPAQRGRPGHREPGDPGKPPPHAGRGP